jgi:hypothetical protein
MADVVPVHYQIRELHRYAANRMRSTSVCGTPSGLLDGTHDKRGESGSPGRQAIWKPKKLLSKSPIQIERSIGPDQGCIGAAARSLWRRRQHAGKKLADGLQFLVHIAKSRAAAGMIAA